MKKLSIVCALVAAALAVCLTPACAGPIGSNFHISGSGCRFPDAAYSSTDSKYLVVWADYNYSPSRVCGRFVSDAGTPLGNTLLISDGAVFALYPAVCYNAVSNEFLVTWDDGRGDTIAGQRISGSSGTLQGGNFIIGASGGGRSSVAWSSASNCYIVVYFNWSEVFGRRVGADGTLLGSEINVTQDADFSGYPSVGYASYGNQFLVTWDYNPSGTNYGYIRGRRIDASTGAMIGNTFQITFGGTEDRSNIAYDDTNRRWMVQFNRQIAGYSYDQYGQLVDTNGALVGGPVTFAHTDWFEGETLLGCDVCYTPAARRFFGSYQLCQGEFINNMGGQEVDSTGVQVGGQITLAVDSSGALSNAADTTKARFLIVWENHEDGGHYIHGQIYAAMVHPISGFSATPGGTSVTLNWTTSSDSHVKRTLIVCKTTGYPTGPTDGIVVADIPGAANVNQNYNHTELSSTQTYYYAAYAYDEAPNYSDPVYTTCRPDGVTATPVITSPVKGSSVTITTPVIQWTGEAHDQYQVRVTQSGDPNIVTYGWDSGVVSGTGSSATCGVLQNYRMYHAFVRVHNSGGWSDWSDAGYTFAVNSSSNTLMLYSADVLPSMFGLAVYDTSSFENGSGITSAIIRDGSSNVWELNDTSTTACCKMRWAKSDVSFNTGATVAARMKATGYNGTIGYNLGISNGNVGGMYLSISTSQVRLVDGSGSVKGSFDVDPFFYHKYQMTVKNAVTNNNDTATWRVYIDGVLRITWTGTGTDAGFDGFMAGHSGVNATGTWLFDWIAGRSDGISSPSTWDPGDANLNAPAVPVVADDGVYTGSLTKLHCSLISSAAQFRYCIGMSAGASDVAGWSVLGPVNGFTRGGLSLAEGVKYYFTVEAGSAQGAWSAPASTNGITVATGASIPEAKGLPNGQIRAIRGCVVTGIFSGFFYVQETNDLSGIKVVSPVSVEPGQILDIAGTVLGADSERYIDCTGNAVTIVAY